MMKPIAVSQLSDNFFETISKEWMLVTAGNKDAFNTMTANWGGIGFLWNKPVVYVFIRPERYINICLLLQTQQSKKTCRNHTPESSSSNARL